MRIVKILGLITLLAVLAYVFLLRNDGEELPMPAIEQVESSEGVIPNHEAADQEVKPYYQGEIIRVEQGGAYTYLEILESTELSFWIVVEKAEAKKGDYVMFQEDLVATDFYSKSLDKTFDEIMFAINLQYKIVE